jgi:HEAT repeat protein
MSCVRLLVIVAPLRLTVWILAVAAAAIVVLIAIGVSRHLEAARANRRREHVRGELEPVFSRFLETEDRDQLVSELRPAFLRMDAAHRPVAAVLVTDLMRDVSPSHRDQIRAALEEAGMVELGELGTRRISPWRRALACEMLGSIGSHRAVPALLARLEDRRPEVRMAAVQALGDIASADAVPALGEGIPRAPCRPDERRQRGAAQNRWRRRDRVRAGRRQPGPDRARLVVLRSSGMAEERAACEFRLAAALDADSDARVRTAAASSLGLLGGDDAPAALRRAATNPDVHLRRAAVKALGSFDDPGAGETLEQCLEDEDRETAIRAAEALLALARRPRAAREADALLDSSSA